MQGLWIYPEDTEVLGVACKSLLKALKSRYQKIALFSPISGGCESFGECESLNPLEFHSAIDKQKALELASAAQEELHLKRFSNAMMNYKPRMILSLV